MADYVAGVPVLESQSVAIDLTPVESISSGSSSTDPSRYHHSISAADRQTCCRRLIFKTIVERLRQYFDFASDISIAAELDPRSFSLDWIKTAVRLGLNRVSLGVQVFDPEVQAAVNRRQSFEMVRRTVWVLREEDVPAINFDLMYGLPRLTTARLLDTISGRWNSTQRIALFGYAHMPWMMARQKLIRDDELRLIERLQQQLAAAGALDRLHAPWPRSFCAAQR